MRFISSNCARENMILGKSIFNSNGELLLNKGISLNRKSIKKIKEIKINGLYIEDDLSENIEVLNIIDENLKINAIRGIKDVFIYSERKSNEGINIVDITKKYVEKIISDILHNKELMVNVIDLKLFDDYTYFHSVNVAVLSIVIGVALSLDRDELYKLGLGALLHDIGKVFVGKELLNKTGKLSNDEFEEIKKHSQNGFNLLKTEYDIPEESCLAVLDHHERFNGTGYPNKKSKSNISLFGRIISIADVYDALTSDRPYRKALLPSEAAAYISSGASSMFDPDLVALFSRKVAPYPIGTCVELNNNQKGIVIKNYEDNCLRPLIRVYEKNGKNIVPFEIDLRNNDLSKDISIIAVNP